MLSIAVLCLMATLVTGVPLKSTYFDHYVFTQEYPAGKCYNFSEGGEGYKCNFPSNASTWTIHGLWPTRGATKKPSHCDKDAWFNPNIIMNLVPQLVAKWTNCLNRTKFFHFWAHEYLKHGTCSGMGESDFFEKVLDIFGQLPHIGNAFNDAGVVPSNQQTHDASNLQAILTAKFGVPPMLQCITLKSREVLIQIQLCLDKNFEPMKCDFARDSTGELHRCSGPVLYPKYSPAQL